MRLGADTRSMEYTTLCGVATETPDGANSEVTAAWRVAGIKVKLVLGGYDVEIDIHWDPPDERTRSVELYVEQMFCVAIFCERISEVFAEGAQLRERHVKGVPRTF